VQEFFDFFASGQTKGKNPLIGMPTGYGKSLVIAEIIRRCFLWFPTISCLVSTHVKELVEQDYNALMSVWPTAPAGIQSAGLGRRDTMHPCLFGSIKSLWNTREALGFRHFMIVDEAHLVSPEAATIYRKLIAYFTSINPYFCVIGLSATLYRTGSGPLSEAEGGIFTHVIFDCTSMNEFNRILDEGWLCRLIPKHTDTGLDVAGVGWAGDDYNQSDAQKAVDKPDLTLLCCRETIAQKEIDHRNSCLIFAQGVDHAEHIAECLQSLGHYALTVHDKTSKEDRRERITSFKNGTLPYLINNNVLTTGFDFPGLDMLSVMRLIGSPGLWVQILGRGTRPLYAPGYPISWTRVDPEACQQRLTAIAASAKRNCLVLDFGKNTERLGPINNPRIPQRRGKKSTPGVAPVKICPQCRMYCFASATSCENCGLEFSREQKLTYSASGLELIQTSAEPRYEVYNVGKTLYMPYEKPGTPPMMKVTYFDAGMVTTPVKEILCFEHRGAGRKRAEQWWAAHTDLPYPASTKDALELQAHIRSPRQLRVRVDEKHPTIAEYLW
jgi:DNA repair protein RadD